MIKNFFGSFFLYQRKVPIIISCNETKPSAFLLV